MKSEVGVWIDHRNAYIYFIDQPLQVINSNLEKHVRFKGGHKEKADSEDQRERQFQTHLNSYYDQVIANIADARSIYIFGPGEAKDEFRSRLKKSKLQNRNVSVEGADKMTSDEIVKKTKKHFHIQELD